MARIDQALWLATENVARFRELLAHSTDDSQRHRLEELLARELERLELLPQDEGTQDPAVPMTDTLPDQPDLSGKPAT